MKKLKYLLAVIAASFIAAVPLAACNSRSAIKEGAEQPQTQTPELPQMDEKEQIPPDFGQPGSEIEVAVPNGEINGEVNEKTEEVSKPETVAYFEVTADGVNIRSGAGTGYSVLGQAEKSTLYFLSGDADGWYKTVYRNKTAYISSKYCTVVNMTSSESEFIEEVVKVGCELLGTPYVYGATRLHDGKGNFYKSFTCDKFDCSSLMQYIFYKGANKLLDVNTRTQIYQGATVTAEQLRRGDLMFFTNAERKNNKGIERIGHVALYLGDNYILHTASDYAKIEQLSSTRWGYFIQGQRIL